MSVDGVGEGPATAKARRGRGALTSAVQHAVLFLFFGPGVGSLLFAAGALLFLTPDTGGAEAVAGVIGLVFVFGYLVGFLPAVLAGLVIGAAGAWVRGRWIYLVALVAGFAAPWAVFGWVNPRPLLEVWQSVVSLGGFGAFAALACTWLARRVGLGRT